MKFEAVVEETIKRTPHVKSIRFNRPEGFQYLPGQYMYVELIINGQKVEKHFTISSSPTESRYIELTKKLTGHEFANALDSLKVGDRVEIDGPEGEFTFVGEYPKILAITGGIGVTPMRSMIRYCTDLRLNSEITLLYSNSSSDEIAFKDEFDDLQYKNDKLKVIYTLTGLSSNWVGLKGRVDGEMIRQTVPDYIDRVNYISGAESMVDELSRILKNDLKVADNRVKTEYFPGY